MIDKIKSKLNDFLALAVVLIFVAFKLVLMFIGIGVVWKLVNLIPVPDWHYLDNIDIYDETGSADSFAVASTIIEYLIATLGMLIEIFLKIITEGDDNRWFYGFVSLSAISVYYWWKWIYDPFLHKTLNIIAYKVILFLKLDHSRLHDNEWFSDVFSEEIEEIDKKNKEKLQKKIDAGNTQTTSINNFMEHAVVRNLLFFLIIFLVLDYITRIFLGGGLVSSVFLYIEGFIQG